VSRTSKPEALAVAKATGRKFIREWIADGTLVDQAAAGRRGADGRRPDSIVTFRHGGQVYYLACVLDLPVDAVQRIWQGRASHPCGHAFDLRRGLAH
jgi:hypothetical protein